MKDAAAPLPLEAFQGSRILACARCRQWITIPAAAIEVGGAHAHERSNPMGIRFRFGCFAAARGLSRQGSPSREATWFPGYTWQVEICDGCKEHMGWLYATMDHRFHGLILAALVEIDPA
ncbi:MAG TPA: cereblon family protein [Haliangiales bacterium]|nr:cereblon family protein [Haliangiales bacterium]